MEFLQKLIIILMLALIVVLAVVVKNQVESVKILSELKNIEHCGSLLEIDPNGTWFKFNLPIEYKITKIDLSPSCHTPKK